MASSSPASVPCYPEAELLGLASQLGQHNVVLASSAANLTFLASFCWSKRNQNVKPSVYEYVSLVPSQEYVELYICAPYTSVRSPG
jgi:hypothetical protein